MTHDHAIELLGNLVDHIAVAENTATQIETLQTTYGFTCEDLLEFGYTENDIYHNYPFRTQTHSYRLTKHGAEAIKNYISDMKAKRKEILDAKKDKAETSLPSLDEIFSDIEWNLMEDEKEYCVSWPVTDNYNSDYPLRLELDKDYVKIA